MSKKYCPECGEQLVDFLKERKALNPDDQNTLENSIKLFLEFNDNRRFYCEHCDLGFE